MIRKKAARKTDAYVSRETIDDSDDSDDSNDGGPDQRRRSSSSTSTRDDRRLSRAESEPQVLIEEQSTDFPVSRMTPAE